MAKLFDISSDFAELFDYLDEIEEMETESEAEKDAMRQAWFDTLTGIETEFEQKAENVAQYIKQLRVESEALDEEAKKLKARANSRKKRMEWLKRYLQECLETMHRNKVEGTRARISLRKNAASLQVVDEAALISELQSKGLDDALKYSAPEIRRTAVKQLIQDGVTLDHAKLHATKSVIIS